MRPSPYRVGGRTLKVRQEAGVAADVAMAPAATGATDFSEPPRAGTPTPALPRKGREDLAAYGDHRCSGPSPARSREDLAANGDHRCSGSPPPGEMEGARVPEAGARRGPSPTRREGFRRIAMVPPPRCRTPATCRGEGRLQADRPLASSEGPLHCLTLPLDGGGRGGGAPVRKITGT